MDKSLYAEYLTYKVQYPTITFEEFVSMKEYCESMIKEEIEYMISSAAKGEEYNPPAGKTPFDDWARKMTREFATEYVEKTREDFWNELAMAAKSKNFETME